MPPRPSVIKSVSLHVHIPEDVYLKMAMHLHSPSEQRVPKGAYQRFMTNLILNFFQEKPDVPSQS